MTISYNWLNQYLPETIAPEKLSEILTSVGLEVESMETFETVKGGLKGLLIGEVMECSQHPNADKLRLTKVNVGKDLLLNIVCGAPNVAQGQKVIVATVGTIIHPLHGDSFEIKKAKIRGEESEGMLCAEDEIGLGESHAGIIVLPENAIIGMLAAEYYNLPPSDMIYEIGLTPNRMDAMSHMGVAKDVCAYLSNERSRDGKIVNMTMKVPLLKNATSNINNQSKQIKFQLSEKCARYAGICIENIEVKESPEWLKNSLKAIGLKPINNIVDITNYVMLECGQPLHAFDLSAIKGDTISVKTVADKTKFMTLDGKEITLSSEDLMICNEDEAMCIAGVYGGLSSGVKETTTSLFIESAWFEPESIRKTSMRLGLRTDAAIRFEKGADVSQTLYALNRATDLILELAGGQITSEVFDNYSRPIEAKTIAINYEKIQKLAGKNYSQAQMKNILLSLCFAIVEENETGMVVKVPYAKSDISMQADIVEEIMRIDGLDNIPFTGKISFGLPDQTGYKPAVKQQVASQLVAKGFYEIFTNSITNAQYYQQKENLVMMMNSLSANLDSMRPSMLETGLEAIAYNLNRKNNHLKFFEFGRIYAQQEGKFIEQDQLAIYVSANYRLPHYSEKSTTSDIYYARGIIEGIFPAMKLDFIAQSNGLDILYQNKKVGTIEELSDAKLKSFDIKQKVWYAILDWQILKSSLENYKAHFTEIPKFPTVQRDLALIVSKQVKYNEIQVAVKQAKSKLLQQMNLFDVFEHEKLGADNISYAVNFSFHDQSKTLTDIEVEAEMKNIISHLEQKVGASIRGN